MRACLLVLVACSSTPRIADVPQKPSCPELAPDIDALVELGHDRLAKLDERGAQCAFERAVVLAEQRARQRGAWQWPNHTQRISSLVFSADGKRLVTAEAEGRVDVWSMSAKRVVQSFHAPGVVRELALSPNGRWIAAQHETTLIWDVETDAVVELPFDRQLAFSPASHLYASKRNGGIVEIDLATKREIATFDVSEPTDLVVAGDTLLVISGLVVFVFDAKTRVRRGEFAVSARSLQHVAPLGSDLAVITDEALLVVGLDGKVRREIAKGRFSRIATSAHDAIAVTTNTGSVLAFDGRTGARLYAIEREAYDDVVFDPRGELLVTGGWTGATLWHARSGRHVSPLARAPSGAPALAFDERGERLAVGNGAGHVAIWSLVGGDARTITVRPGEPIEHVAFDSDGELATATQSHVAVFDARGERRWSTPADRLAFLGYRPRSQALSTISTVTFDQAAYFKLALWNRDGTFDKFLDGVDVDRGFRWNPDGTPAKRFSAYHVHTAVDATGRVASSTGIGRVAIWKPGSAAPSRVVFDDNGHITAIAWTPSGTLVTAAHDTATLWDPATGDRLAVLEAPAPIQALATHPGGRMLATGLVDGRVVLWSIATAAPIATLHSPGELVAYVTTPDGAIDGTLASSVLAWNVAGTPLPAHGAFARQRVSGLLAARMANVPTETAPRADSAGFARPSPPPACYPADTKTRRSTSSSSLSADQKQLRVCMDYSYRVRNNVSIHPPPLCFEVDLATGTYAPSAPTPSEAIGIRNADAAVAEHSGNIVRVCKNGCREVLVRKVDNATSTRVDVDDDATTIAVAYRLDARDAVLVYDVASGKRLSQFIAHGNEHSEITFLGDTLLVSSTTCEEECFTSNDLVSMRTGRRIASVPVDNTMLVPVKIGGDVWAFNDATSPKIVQQNVRTGRVVGRLALPKRACTSDPDVREYMSCEGQHYAIGDKLVVLPNVRPGDVVIVDRRGKLVAEYALPICQ